MFPTVKNVFKSKKKRCATVLFALTTICFNPLLSGVSAKVITSSDGTTSSIQSAINSAVSGDTIRIPQGTFSFSGSVSLNAGISIIGTGTSSTILRKSGSSATPMFTINGSNGQRVSIGHFSMIGVTSSSSSVQDVGIRLNNCKDFDVQEMNFNNFGNAAIYVKGNSRGLVRECRFVDIYRPAIGSLGYGVVVYGDGSGAWSRPLDLGTENAIYVEDCYFKNNRHAIASNDGARYVFRYNTVMDNAGNFQAIDAHGREYGSSRGTRSYEIYNNTIDNSVRTSPYMIFIRGGDGVIFNNSLLRGCTKNQISLANRTDGSQSSTSYPAPDQTRKLYVWDNTDAAGKNVGVSIRSGHESFFKPGRDFFLESMPGYTPYTYPHPLSIQNTPVAIAEMSSPALSSTLQNKTGVTGYIPGKSIRYFMSEPGIVRLSVHDLNGKTVEVLLNKAQSTGSYEYSFDSGNAKSFAAAKYVFRLSLGSQTFSFPGNTAF
ncbi:MAG: hypothetical protein GX640_03825 [Fibrobacter sp.]|nr:hypothetical protein [Fibrobacter sp.]